MNNKLFTGDVITITSPAGGTTSGGALLVGTVLGVATADSDEGDLVAVELEGVFELPKLSTGVFTVGEKLYWDATNTRLTDVSTDNTECGIAFAAAANPSSTGVVKLKGR